MTHVTHEQLIRDQQDLRPIMTRYSEFCWTKAYVFTTHTWSNQSFNKKKQNKNECTDIFGTSFTSCDCNETMSGNCIINCLIDQRKQKTHLLTFTAVGSMDHKPWPVTRGVYGNGSSHGNGIPMGFTREWELDLNKGGNGNGNTTWEWERLTLVGSQNHCRGLVNSHFLRYTLWSLWLSDKGPQCDFLCVL